MILETRGGKMQKSLETIYDEFVDSYCQGNFTEGSCSWNGDDALMSPMTFGNRFAEHCSKLGYDAYDYEGPMKELIDRCNDYLKQLESKFR